MIISLDAMRAVAAQRGAGYVDACLAAGRVVVGEDGREMLELTGEAYEDLRSRFSPPALTQQGIGLLGSVAGEARAMLAGREAVSADAKARRLAICERCEFWMAAQRRCAKCGCYMDTKAEWRAARCPVGKW